MEMNLGKLWEMVRDRDARHAAVHGVTKSQTRLSNYHMPYCAAEMNTALQIQQRILTNQSISKANNSLLYVESKKQNQ